MFIWILFLTYSVLWLACGFRAYTQGFYNIGAFIVQVIIKFFYIAAKIEIFFVVVRFTLDIRLTTQVLSHGQVMIVGFDQFQREALRFYMNNRSRSISTTDLPPGHSNSFISSQQEFQYAIVSRNNTHNGDND